MAQVELELVGDDPLALPKHSGAWAWGICWLMFASTVLNYMDRQSIALAAPQIKETFHLSNADFGWVMAAFYLSYALFQVPAGYLVDRWNVRWAYAGAVGWWSLAAMATSFSPSLGILMALRATLGVGESFNWPCALRATSLILPPKDRSLGNGIFNSGAAVGAVLTPLIVTPLTFWLGWRTAFLVVGALGLAWVVLWLRLLGGERRHWFAGRTARRPNEGEGSPPSRGLSPIARTVFLAIGGIAILLALSGVHLKQPGTWWRVRIVNAEVALPALSAVRIELPAIWWGISFFMVGLLLAARVVPLGQLKGADWAESLGEIVRLRRFWVLVLVSVSINVCWHFLVGWLPNYLKEDRGLTYLTSGLLSAVPFLAADAGNLGGGALSRWLAGRGLTAVRARMAVMAVCTLIITSGAWVGWVRSDALVIVLLGLMAMGTAAFMANYFAFTQEVSPRHTGLIVGILGGLGNLFAAGFLPVAGYVKDATQSFGPIFVLVGVLPFVGLTALVAGWGETREEGSKPS